MTVERRLAKLEQVINQPCDWCRYWDAETRRVKDSLQAQGCTLYQPKPKDLEPGRCSDCGQPRVYDHSFQSAAERAATERLWKEEKAAIAEGRDLNRAWWGELLRLWDDDHARRREYYGSAYDAAIADTGFADFREFICEQMDAATA